jgi:hypothetical protein
MATCVVIQSPENVEVVEVDDSDMSPFTQQVLNPDPEQKVTILGSWQDCTINMLGLTNSTGPNIPEHMLPRNNRAAGPLKAPIMFCRLDENYRVVAFGVNDYHALIGST